MQRETMATLDTNENAHSHEAYGGGRRSMLVEDIVVIRRKLGASPGEASSTVHVCVLVTRW